VANIFKPGSHHERDSQKSSRQRPLAAVVTVASLIVVPILVVSGIAAQVLAAVFVVPVMALVVAYRALLLVPAHSGTFDAVPAAAYSILAGLVIGGLHRVVRRRSVLAERVFSGLLARDLWHKSLLHWGFGVAVHVSTAYLLT
jgi:hypothetical protein